VRAAETAEKVRHVERRELTIEANEFVVVEVEESRGHEN